MSGGLQKVASVGVYEKVAWGVGAAVACGNMMVAAYTANKCDAALYCFPTAHIVAASWCIGKGAFYGMFWPISLLTMAVDLMPGRPFGRHWCPGAGINGYDGPEMKAYLRLGLLPTSYRDEMERCACKDDGLF